MRIKNIFKRKLSKYDQLVDDIQLSFNSAREVDKFLAKRIKHLDGNLSSLMDEIANNGVVRDLRKLEKENKILRDELAGLNVYVDEVEANLDELKRHTATLITQHDEQINQTQVEDKRKLSMSELLWSEITSVPFPGRMQPTLAGKVEAILEHLNLDVSVKPEEVKKAKVEAKKKKSVKKGKK